MPKRYYPGDEPWREQALCGGMNTNLFFAERGVHTDEAKAICRRCPVRSDCLEHAMTCHERTGVWGGLTPKERRKLAKRRRLGL